MSNVIAADADNIGRAAEVIRRGGIVAFPTETVYGLGANALDAVAAARVFEAKHRPHFDPLIVHLADIDDLGRVSESNTGEDVKRLMAGFWPGPLTVVLPKLDVVPGIITSGLPTVAVRVPSHPVARQLIEQADVPIAAPSANRFGSLSPTRAQHVRDSLGDAVDVILDGGASTWGVESTIVSVVGGLVTVLRLGAITVEDIESVVGPVKFRSDDPDKTILAPGGLAQHYSPDTYLRVITRGVELDEDTSGAIYIAFNAPPNGTFREVHVLSASGDLREAAARLFDVLHQADANAAPEIIAELMPDHGLGRAINDRLTRAAARF